MGWFGGVWPREMRQDKDLCAAGDSAQILGRMGKMEKCCRGSMDSELSYLIPDPNAIKLSPHFP